MKKNGYTLVEILVGVVIGVISVAAAFSAYNYYTKSYDSVSQKAQVNKTAREGLSIILKDLRNAGYIDPTFISSVFTGVTATFRVKAGGKKKSSNSDAPNISKADMEKLIEKATQSAPTQTIKLEVPAVKISS